jgi:hypothetical protein
LGEKNMATSMVDEVLEAAAPALAPIDGSGDNEEMVVDRPVDSHDSDSSDSDDDKGVGADELRI